MRISDWSSDVCSSDLAPDRFALESVGADGETFDTQTFSALAINVQKAAKTFLGLGIGKGDHVFIMLPRCPEWYFAMLAAMRIGAVPMPAPNMLTAKDIAYRIAKAGAVAAVTDDAGSAKIDSIRSEEQTSELQSLM